MFEFGSKACIENKGKEKQHNRVACRSEHGAELRKKMAYAQANDNSGGTRAKVQPQAFVIKRKQMVRAFRWALWRTDSRCSNQGRCS